jgi:hypothetical protein
VNLVTVRIEDSHRDGVRRPINLGHKRDAPETLRALAPFPKDVGRAVKELDSVLHSRVEPMTAPRKLRLGDTPTILPIADGANHGQGEAEKRKEDVHVKYKCRTLPG